MTIDEFLPWAEVQERGRYELHDGQAIMMSPERAGHWKVKALVFVSLRQALKEASLPCHAVPDGATVRITQRTAFEPDALVYCGSRPAEPETLYATHVLMVYYFAFFLVLPPLLHRIARSPG